MFCLVVSVYKSMDLLSCFFLSCSGQKALLHRCSITAPTSSEVLQEVIERSKASKRGLQPEELQLLWLGFVFVWVRFGLVGLVGLGWFGFVWWIGLVGLGLFGLCLDWWIGLVGFGLVWVCLFV